MKLDKRVPSDEIITGNLKFKMESFIICMYFCLGFDAGLGDLPCLRSRFNEFIDERPLDHVLGFFEKRPKVVQVLNRLLGVVNGRELSVMSIRLK